MAWCRIGTNADPIHWRIYMIYAVLGEMPYSVMVKFGAFVNFSLTYHIPQVMIFKADSQYIRCSLQLIFFLIEIGLLAQKWQLSVEALYFSSRILDFLCDIVCIYSYFRQLYWSLSLHVQTAGQTTLHVNNNALEVLNSSLRITVNRIAIIRIARERLQYLKWHP